MPPLAVSLGYILLIALWGSTWAAIKVGIDAVPPFVFAFERAVAVSVILVGLSLAMRLPFPRDRRVIVAAVVVGIINIGTSWAIIFWSEQYVPSGLVSVFGASSPIWTALLAHFLVRGDRLSATKVIGLVLGMAGMGVLVGAPDTSGGPEVLVASALLALMPITWAVGTVLQARALRHGSPLPLVAIGACAGSLFLLPFAAAQSGDAGDWSINVALAFGYLVATDHDDAFAGRDPRAGSSYRRARAGRAHHLAHGRGRGAGGGCVSPQRSRRRGCSGGTSPGRVSRRLGRLARHSISGKSAFTSKRDGTIVGLTGPATNSPVGSGGPTHVVPSFDPRDRCCTWSRVLDQHRSWHRQRVQPDRQWRALLGT